MSIGFLPPFQNKESLYSYLANLYMKSGYLSARQFIDDIFVGQGAIDKDFYNVFNRSFFAQLCETFSWEDIILNHTSFKYFTRFISNEQRKQAWKEALKNGPRIRRYIIFPRNYNSKKERKLKYCPCCCIENKLPYYSISHQYKESIVCPVCGCYLEETSVRSDSAHLGVFHPLVGEPHSKKLKMALDDNVDYCLARYIDKVNDCELVLNCKASIGDYLTYRLRGTKYLKGIRGGKKDMDNLYRDISEFYKELTNNPLTFAHLKFIFEDKMNNPYEICMIAMFLNITPKELSNYGKNVIRPLSDSVDEQIIKLYKCGKRIFEIANILQCPRETVRKVIICRSKKNDSI